MLYGTVSVAALAGCTSSGMPRAGTGSEGDQNGDTVETALQQVGQSLSESTWDRTEQRGLCVLITEGSNDNTEIFDDPPEAAITFLEDTDFTESVVVYIESVGPTTCYDTVGVDSVRLEDGTLVANATVEGAENDTAACGEAITYAAALLRVTSNQRPEAVRLSVTDGWGETGTVRDTNSMQNSE